jgi:hypothetical protein
LWPRRSGAWCHRSACRPSRLDGRPAGAIAAGRASAIKLAVNISNGKIAYFIVIADNRLAENAGWDRNLLGLEFQYLSELDLDFDIR